MAQNHFDRYDEPSTNSADPAGAAKANHFDQYDPPPPPRTWGEAAKDTGLGIAQGAVNLVGGAASLVEMTNPINTLRRTLGEFGVGSGPSSVAADLTTSASDGITRRLSPTMQRKKQELAETEGFVGSAKKVITDPALLGQFVSEQVPTLATMGAGAVATGSRAAAGAAGAANAARTGALARGATAEAAEQAAGAVTADATKRAATKFITGASTAIESGNANVQAIQEALAQPEEVWQANPRYQALVAGGLDPEAAKRMVAGESGAVAATVAAPLSYAGARIAAPFEAEVFTRMLPGAPRSLLSAGSAGRVAGGAAREAAEEAVQEGGAQFGVNVGLSQVDPSRRLLEGVPEAAGTGAALGAVIGGGLGAGNLVTARRRLPERGPLGRVANAAGEDSVAETINASPDLAAAAAPGAVDPAAAGSPPLQAVAAAQAEAPLEQTTLPLADEAAAAESTPSAQAQALMPIAPPWINQETGEFTDPTDEQLRAQLAAQIELQSQAGRGLRIPRRQLAAAWGVTPERIRQQVAAVMSARKASPETESAIAAEQYAQGVSRGTSPDTVPQQEGFLGQRTIAEDNVDLEETQRGLEVDTADAQALREALAAGVSPVDGRPLASEGMRRQYESELATLEESIDRAQAFVASRTDATATPAPASEPPRNTVPVAGGERAKLVEGIRAAQDVTEADVAALGAKSEVGVAAAAQLYAEMAGMERVQAMPLVRQLPRIPGKQDRLSAVAVLKAAKAAQPSQQATPSGEPGVPAPARPPLSVRMGNQEVEVDSFEDASRKFLELKDSIDLGGMPVVELIDQAGKGVGWIGQRGQVYEGDFQVERSKREQREPAYVPPSMPRRRDDLIDSNAAPAAATPRAARAQQLLGATAGQVVRVSGQGRELQAGSRYRVAEVQGDGSVRLEPASGDGQGFTLTRKELEREVKEGAAFEAEAERASAPAQAAAATAADDRRANEAERARIDALPADERDAEIQRLRGRVAELERETRTNPLTGLPNKAAFEADEALGWPSVVAIDMDGLKRLNDSVGHENADAVLRALGRELDALAGDDARFYHRSGDEFAARFKDPDQAAEVMASLQTDLEGLKAMLRVEVAGQASQEYEYRGIGISYGLGQDYEQADLAANEQKRERLAAGLREDARADGPSRRLREVPRDPEGRQGDPDGATAAAPEVAPPAPATSATPAPAGVSASAPATIKAAANQAATSPKNGLPAPTEGQIEAGNYRKGHVQLNGLAISIENPAGSRRRPEWPPLKHHYGYIKRTEGADGDHVDVFLGDKADDPLLPAFIVNQVNRDGSFDEHKVVLGFPTEEAARAAYLANYTKGWTGLGSIRAMSLPEFKTWLREGDTAKPVSTDLPVPKVSRRGGRASYVANESTLAAYFQPGRVVQGYGSLDRVIEFLPAAGDETRWAVRVIEANADGSARRGAAPRVHSTVPSAKELAKVLGLPSAVKPARAPAAPAKTAEQPAARRPLPGTKKAAAAAAPATPAVIEDVGQKIGGARKDLWRDRGLQVADLEGMTGGEQAQFAVKASVWKPDYAAMIEGGMDPGAAARVKGLWDRVAAKPHTDSADARRQYVEAVGIVREILSAVRTVEDAEKATTVFEQRSGRAALTDRITSWEDAKRRVPLYAAIARKQGYRWKFWTNAWRDQRAAADLLKTGWPAKSTSTKGEGGTTKKPEPARPHLDNVPRTGPDHRANRDVTAEDFRQAFAFRGVEFGNWAAQDERQKLVNLAYDGLMDMARVLGLPPRALSLNGTLGLALGARGSGRAAAHYEPGKVVINMTKINGAGALAHEWGHALDHYFGELDQTNPYSGHGRYASGGRGQPVTSSEDARLAQLRPEMQKAWDRVLQSIYTKTRSKAEEARYVELNLERLQAAIAQLESQEQKQPYEQNRIEAMKRRAEGMERELEFIRSSEEDAEWAAGPSDMLRAISELGLGPYWKRPTELLARSFEAYVNGKIEDEGNRSQYLASIPSAPVWPQRGGELERVTRAFDAFFKAVQTEETPQGVRLFSIAGRAGSDRAPWNDFPPVAIAEPFGPGQRRLRDHADYAPAKAGDADAALRLAQDYVTDDVVQQIRTLVGTRQPFLVPVVAQEQSGHNAIPAAFAEVLASRLGLDVQHEIVQSVRAHHTAAGAYHRLAYQAAFDGPVEPGQDYLILDDAITMGGTLANLRGHIEANGGRVIGASVLTGHPNGATMALSPATLQRLRETFGNDLETYLRDEFGFGIEHLSEGEAGHVLAARTLDAVRDRIAQARSQAEGRVHAPGARSAGPAEGLNRPGLALERAQALKNRLTAKWGDNAPSVLLVESAEEFPSGAKVDADYLRAEGFYDGRPMVWLNLAQIPDEKRFGEVLAHEAMGHFGFERVVTPAQWTQIRDTIARLEETGKGSAVMQEILRATRARYPEADVDQFAREVVAVMAERGVRNTLMARVIAAVRTFLRQLMPSLDFSYSEIQQLLVASDRFLRSGMDYETRAAQTQAMAFSRAPAADVLEDIQGLMALERDGSVLDRLRQAIKDATPAKVKDALRGTWLGALGTNHLTDLGSDYFDGMRHYTDFLKSMEADRNALMAQAEELAEKARKWASKNMAMARRLFDLMHETTIDGVDPSKEYQVLQFRYGGKLHDATRKNVADAIKQIRQQMRERSGDPKQDMLNRIKALTAMQKAEQRRRKQYGGLVGRWTELSPEAQELFKEIRDAYAARSEAVEEALVQRIEDLKGDGVSDGHRRALVAKIREQFETNRLQGVYFPLQRFGNYFVAAEKGDTSTFLMFESLNKAERAEKDLKRRGWTVTSRGKRIDQKAENAPSGTFVAEVIGELRKANISEKTQDSIYQLYLNALPELSMRKHQIHRKAVPGFDPDAVRAFGWHMQHGSHQLAKLRYMHKLEGVLKLLEGQQKEARKAPSADVRRIAAGDAILEELNRRHEWIANPVDSALTNKISSIGFANYLGLTPAAALVNLSQTAIVTYPVLAAKHGHVKAMNALLTGMRDSMRTVGNSNRVLTDPAEQRAYESLEASGTFEKTQAHNLAGIAEGGLQGYNPAWAKTMEIVGWAFHKAEVVNREASAMAAFRLATEEGMPFDAAVKYAHDVVMESHFDYSNANRARFMQSGTAKVLLMFRQYSLNMTWFLARNTWLATKGTDPDTRKMARRKLTGVLGMTALFSGTMGLPLISSVFGVLNAAAATFGDDDEPWDAETEFRNFLADYLGEDAARLVATGPVNEITGADIAGRVSLSQLWFRDADRELEGRGMYFHLLEQAAGPMGGMLKNYLVGKQQIDEGHLWRGVETMLPKALKDAMKGARYSVQGVNNLRGDPLVEDVSVWQALLQLQGFTPAEVANQYDANRALKNYEQAILGRRQRLLDSYAMATRLGDAEGRQAAREKIRAFNRANPEVMLNSRTLRRSLRDRLRYSERAANGIVLDRRLARRIQEDVRFVGDGG